MFSLIHLWSFGSVVSGPVTSWDIMAEEHDSGKQPRSRAGRSQGKNTVPRTCIDDMVPSSRSYFPNVHYELPHGL